MEIFDDYIITFGEQDLEGDTFLPDTHLWLDYMQPKMIVYNHLVSPHPIGMSIENGKLLYNDATPSELYICGEIKSLAVDDIGLKATFVIYDKLPQDVTSKFDFWNSEIDKEHQYWLSIVKQKYQNGQLGFSSDSVGKLLQREQGDDKSVIKSWPIPFVSLTHMPAEARNNKLVNQTIINRDLNSIDSNDSHNGNNLAQPNPFNQKGLLTNMETPMTDTEKMTPEDTTKEVSLDELASMITALKDMIAGVTKPIVEDENEEMVESEKMDMPLAETDDTSYKAAMEDVKKEVKSIVDLLATNKGAGAYATNMSNPTKSFNINTITDKSDDPYKFSKAIRLMRDKPSNMAREIKALGLLPASSGGFTTQVEQSNELIDMLLARSVFLDTEGRGLVDLYPMASDTMTIPVLASGGTAYWIGENSAITQSDPTFEQRTLVAKKLAMLIPISNELLADNSVALETKLRETMVKIMNNSVDQTILFGSGVANQPLGIRNVTGATQTALNAVPTYDNLVDAIGRLESANIELDDSVRWIFNPREKATLRKLEDGAGNLIWTDSVGISMTAGAYANAKLVGYDWTATTNAALGVGGNAANESDIYLAKWSDLIVGLRSEIEIQVSDVAGTAFQNDQTWIRAILRMDTVVKHPESFQILTDVRIS